MKKPNKIIKANGGEEPEDEYSDMVIGISKDRPSMVLCPLEGEESDGWEEFIELKSSIRDFYRFARLTRKEVPHHETLGLRQTYFRKTDFFKEQAEELFKDAFSFAHESIKSAKECDLWNKMAPKALGISDLSGTNDLGVDASLFDLGGMFEDMLRTFAVVAGIALSRVERYVIGQKLNYLDWRDCDFVRNNAGVDRSWSSFYQPKPKETQLALDWLATHRYLFDIAQKNLFRCVIEVSIESNPVTKYRIDGQDPKFSSDKNTQREELLKCAKQKDLLDERFEETLNLPALRMYSTWDAFNYFGCNNVFEYEVVSVSGVSNSRKSSIVEITSQINESRELLSTCNIAEIQEKVDIAKPLWSVAQKEQWEQRITDYNDLAQAVDWADDRLRSIGYYEGKETEVEREGQKILIGHLFTLPQRLETWITSVSLYEDLDFDALKAKRGHAIDQPDTIKSSLEDDLISEVTKRLETIASQRGDKYGITQPAVIWFLGLTEPEQLTYNEKTSTGGVIGTPLTRTKEKKAESFKNVIRQTLLDEEWEKSKQPLGTHPKYQEFVEMFPKEAVKGNAGSKELKGSNSPKGVKAPIMAAWLVENLEDLTSIQMSNHLEPYIKRPKGAMTAARLKAQKKRSQQKS